MEEAFGVNVFDPLQDLESDHEGGLGWELSVCFFEQRLEGVAQNLHHHGVLVALREVIKHLEQPLLVRPAVGIQYLEDLILPEELGVLAGVLLDLEPHLLVALVHAHVDLPEGPRPHLVAHNGVLPVTLHPKIITSPNQNTIIAMHQPQPLSSFKISLEKLEAEFECQICYNMISDCYVTRCGHVYCKACIEETVGRHHRCPFCTQELADFKADVFKNYHFNTIKKIVDEERKKQTDKYLNKVFATDLKSKMEQENDKVEQLMQPIEAKIVEQCQQALLQYRKFALKLYEVEKEAEEKKALLGAVRVRDHGMIIKGIQDTILGSLPSPVISPDTIEKSTNIEILLPGNKIHKNILKLSPMSTFETLLPYVEKLCSEHNIMLQGKLGETIDVNGRPVSLTSRFGLLAGDTIRIDRGIPFEVKVYCYTHGWEKGKVGAFFTCNSCAVKWICESCALYCHEGHDLKVQLKEHKSEWAICYCVTKCDCRAINKNTME